MIGLDVPGEGGDLCAGVSLTRVREEVLTWNGVEGAACVVTGVQTVISIQSAQRRRDLVTNFGSDERFLPQL